MWLILSPTEVAGITGCSRYRAQSRALARMGISYRLRPDGFPVVSRTHFEEIMGVPASRRSTATEPDWSAMDA
jgi:hypothetical protein